LVLSLAFVLAFIGAAVGLLVGILIFGEISEAIECPSETGGGGSAGDDLFNTLGLADTELIIEGDEDVEFIGQLLTLSNQQIYSVRVENMNWTLPEEGYMIAKIWSNVTLDDIWEIEEASSETITFGTGSPYRISDFNHTFIFTTNPILSGSDIVIGFEMQSLDPVNSVSYSVISFDVGGNEGTFVEGEPNEDEFNPWHTCQGAGGACAPPFNPAIADIIPMQVTLFVGTAEVGSEQCEQAKDTAWTVIGIMPVALFFGLFALFSSFGKPQ